MCHKKNKETMYCVCALVIFGSEKQKNPSTVSTSEVFLASNGENLILRPKKILPKAHFLRYQPQIWNTTCFDLWL